MAKEDHDVCYQGMGETKEDQATSETEPLQRRRMHAPCRAASKKWKMLRKRRQDMEDEDPSKKEEAELEVCLKKRMDVAAETLADFERSCLKDKKFCSRQRQNR